MDKECLSSATINSCTFKDSHQMKKIMTLSSLLATSLCASAYANDLTIDIGNDVLKAEFTTEQVSENTQFAIAGLTTEDDTHLISLKGLVTGTLKQHKYISAALGAKVSFASLDNAVVDENIQALALGGEVIFTVPDVPEVSLEVGIYYAPAITLSDDLDYLSDVNLRVSYKLIENGSVYVGYRNIKAAHDNGADYTIDSGAHVGFQFSF